jgi:hypothetical protein
MKPSTNNRLMSSGLIDLKKVRLIHLQCHCCATSEGEGEAFVHWVMVPSVPENTKGERARRPRRRNKFCYAEKKCDKAIFP